MTEQNAGARDTDPDRGAALDAESGTQDINQRGGCGRWLYSGKPWEAFKTFALIFSFIVNIVFFVVLLAIAPLILPLVNDIVNPLVSGLNDSFVQMGEAEINRQIVVDDVIPIAFTLPLDTDTRVVVTEGVPLNNVPAQFVLPGGGGYINGLVSLTLPAGLELPVHLALDVPVEQTVPVQLTVDVNIPLDETELGVPFKNLQEIFGPLTAMLTSLPKDNEDLINRITEPQSAPEATATPEGAN
jgi:hypothetical protein